MMVRMMMILALKVPTAHNMEFMIITAMRTIMRMRMRMIKMTIIIMKGDNGEGVTLKKKCLQCGV